VRIHLDDGLLVDLLQLVRFYVCRASLWLLHFVNNTWLVHVANNTWLVHVVNNTWLVHVVNMQHVVSACCEQHVVSACVVQLCDCGMGLTPATCSCVIIVSPRSQVRRVFPV
jgi:hypothetical protein